MARLVVLAGLPAVGKSCIARELAHRTGAIWLRVDTMDQAIWASGTAPEDLRDWTYRAGQAVAADNLALGHDVIADCVNDCREAREGWDLAARRAGADVVWLEVVCSDTAEHRRRVETREGDVPGLKLPDWDKVSGRDYHSMDRDHARIDTSGRTVEACAEDALRLLET
jgi:predicted kinase